MEGKGREEALFSEGRTVHEFIIDFLQFFQVELAVILGPFQCRFKVVAILSSIFDHFVPLFTFGSTQGPSPLNGGSGQKVPLPPEPSLQVRRVSVPHWVPRWAAS